MLAQHKVVEPNPSIPRDQRELRLAPSRPREIGAIGSRAAGGGAGSYFSRKAGGKHSSVSRRRSRSPARPIRSRQNAKPLAFNFEGDDPLITQRDDAARATQHDQERDGLSQLDVWRRSATLPARAEVGISGRLLGTRPVVVTRDRDWDANARRLVQQSAWSAVGWLSSRSLIACARQAPRVAAPRSVHAHQGPYCSLGAPAKRLNWP